jgi:hypothetical protein
LDITVFQLYLYIYYFESVVYAAQQIDIGADKKSPSGNPFVIGCAADSTYLCYSSVIKTSQEEIILKPLL